MIAEDMLTQAQQRCIPDVSFVFDNHGFRIAQRTGAAFFCRTDDCLHRHSAHMVFEHIVPDSIPIRHNDASNAHQDVAREGVVFSLPCCRCQTERSVQNSLSIFVIDALQCRNCTDTVFCFGRGDCQAIGLHNGLNHLLFGVICFNMRLEGLERGQRLDMLLLVGKDMGFLLIFQVIVDHTPHRGITGTGLTGNDLDGVLAVKHIVDAVAAAHLDRVDLVDVKFFQCLTDMIFGQRPLVLLIGNQISDGDQLNKKSKFRLSLKTLYGGKAMSGEDDFGEE